MGLCYNCFKEIEEHATSCPCCGHIVDNQPKEPIYLAPGTVLADRYVLGHCVGAGGFGVIYRAWDRNHETVVAVKEFFAGRLVTRAAGTKDVIVNQKSQAEFTYRKTRFLAEARNMAMFGAHRSIPNVFEFFEENNTAYIVMELLNGQALNDYLRNNGGKLDTDFAVMITNEVGNALISMHEKGIIHRDVAPDNIYINSDKNLSIKLLDLGAAKLTDTDDDVIDIILKPGYSPVEQYDNTGAIGPWTDVYALGASLYVMLTGVKPPESTNRKIDDTLVAPHLLDPSIPEQLSLTAMKAMALDKHMRFKSVSEFLKALNGQKKVIPLEKEKRRRRNGRLAGVLCALLAVALVTANAFSIYQAKKTEELLEPAEISIWFCQQEGSTEEEALQAVIDDFRKTYSDVTIALQGIPESEYAQKLQEAAENDSLPTLFESDKLSQDILDKCADLSAVLETEQAKDCLLLQSYKGTKQVPLAFQIPMAYVITNGVTALDYTDSYFSKASDFATDAGISLDSTYETLVTKNFAYENFKDCAEFMNGTENTCAVMLSSSMAFNAVRQELPGYEKQYVFPKADKVACEYVYFWSSGGGDKAQTAAAERLLSWMLGNNYQNMLMISYCNDGQLPLNKECFAEKAEQKYWEPLKEIKNSFVIE